MRELEVYESGIHKCGYHRDLLEDKSNIFMPEEWTCPVCAGASQRSRMLRKRDEHAVANENGPQPSEGREIHMRLLPPSEAEKVRQVLRERRGGSGQRGGHSDQQHDR